MIARFLKSLRERVVVYQPFELLVMRVLFALVVYRSIRWTREYPEPSDPNGLAQWIDLTAFGEPDVLAFLRVFILVPLSLYVAGVLPVVSIASILCITVGIGTLANSGGSIGHSAQIVSLILLGQLVGYALGAWRERSLSRGVVFVRRWMHNASVHLAKLMLAAAYVVSGCSKLIESDGQWIYKVPLMALQITKGNLRDQANTLVEKTGFFQMQLPQLIIDYPNLARIFFGMGLGLELFCFLALVGRRWAFLFGVGLITMHWFIGQIMALHFDLHVYCLAIFFVNLPGVFRLFGPVRDESDLSLPWIGGGRANGRS